MYIKKKIKNHIGHEYMIVLCLIGIMRDHMVSEKEQRLLTQLVVSFVIAHESEIWYMRT